MNYIIDDDTGVNIENYEYLAAAIITQAVKDIETGLMVKKRLKGSKPKNIKDLTALNNYEDAERFFDSEWFYLLVKNKDVDGSAVLKKARQNFFKYGKCMFTVDDWEKIRTGKSVGKYSHSIIHKQGGANM